MAYPIDRKLVVGVSSNALFDLTKEDEVFRKEGLSAYRKFQTEHLNTPLEKGHAFPFIKRFLGINIAFPENKPVEVVLLSMNGPETGMRIFRSIKHFGLDISRAAFTSGRSPFEFIPAFNISLFLSTDQNDVDNAIQAGYPAGRFIAGEMPNDDDDPTLKVGFDFDGVIADDQAEAVFQATKDVNQFHQFEVDHAKEPHQPGPLGDFFKKLSYFQKLESKRQEDTPSYQKILRTSIITARNAPAHERAVNTLQDWGVTVDEMFLLGGIDKSRIFEVLRPHIYFDDQLSHLKNTTLKIPMVHIPFGVTNIRN